MYSVFFFFFLFFFYQFHVNWDFPVQPVVRIYSVPRTTFESDEESESEESTDEEEKND